MENAPELLPGLGLYYTAFAILDRERPVGMTEGRIPRRAVREYAEELRLDVEQTDLLHYVIGKMDEVVMKRRAAKT